jgi:pyruvate formate lyase activating enzyme
MTKGIVSDIQRFSIHDGPGIRTTVFLKGCNVRCKWCQNPESIDRLPEIQFIQERCIGCGACLDTCKQDVHQVMNGKHILHREQCTGCGECALSCYAKALTLVGREMTEDEVMQEVRQDIPYYENSNGGVTISGGEPLVQHQFTYALLVKCHAENIHVALETNLLSSWYIIERMLPLLDLLIIDIKTFDKELHKKWVGVSNAKVLDNARKLAGTQTDIIVRTPVIPLVNDSRKEIAGICDVIMSLPNLIYYELLSYNPLGVDKYRWLGKESILVGKKRQSTQALLPLTREAMSRGIQIRVDGVTVG